MNPTFGTGHKLFTADTLNSTQKSDDRSADIKCLQRNAPIYQAVKLLILSKDNLKGIWGFRWTVLKY